MKKILFGIFAVVGLVAGDAFGVAYAKAGKYCANNANATCGGHCGGGITPGTECWNVTSGEVCNKANAKKCYVKCICNTNQDNAYWIASRAVECNDGYVLQDGKCVKPESEASASAANASATATKKVASCSCRNHVAGGACAEAGIVNKKCVPTKCPKTVTEKGKTYNTYMVRNGKGGAVQYFCHNDALCELGNAKKKLSDFPQYALNTWQEGNVWYTDKKCKCADSTRVLKNGNCVCGGDTPIDNNGTCISQAHKDCIDTNGTWTASACDCGSKVLNGTKCEEKSEPPVSQSVEQTVAPVEENKQEPQPTEFEISGSIVDQDNEPLIATVTFGNWGVTAGEDGKFSTTYKGNPDDMLEISHVGCTSQKFKPADLKNKTIKLTCETSIEEVAVVGCKGDVDNGIKAKVMINGQCYPSECVTPGWKLTGSGVDAQCVKEEESTTTVVPGDGEDKDPTPEDDTPEEVVDEEPEEDVIDEEPEEESEYDPEREQRIADAQAKYDAAKANEQSLGNRMLGAASMGSMGIGGMMVASSLSEQKADDEAEIDMKAYLATFRCAYGNAKNIKGGEVNIELPGASELIPLYAEYVALANDLKSRKAQLGIKAGIESEKILDSATTGLYDDVGTGVTSGAYASLARALQNPDGEDAKMWNEQKDKTAKNLKTGAITAGVGAAVGIVGNIISKAVTNKKYKSFEDLENKISAGTTATTKCPSQSTGTYPNCICNSDKEYNANKNECRACTGGQKIDNTDGYAKCVCMGDTPLWDTERGRCIARPNSCNNGFVEGADGKCDCPADRGMTVQGGKCVIIETVTRALFSTTDVSTATLDAGHLFNIGSAEIQASAQEALTEFADGLKNEALSDCKISIIGYTDPVGSADANQRLSEQRANAIKTFLESLQAYKDVVTSTSATGNGENNCTCGVGAIPAGQENSADYKFCVGKAGTYPVSGNNRYAPCRRVVIEASCTKGD